MGYFNPRTPCGVRRVLLRYLIVYNIFQSTHPLRGATGKFAFLRGSVYISIHAPLAGCDMAGVTYGAQKGHFNPRTPCGVRQKNDAQNVYWLCDFNPRTPCGVRHYGVGNGNYPNAISIHAPLAGCD